MIVNCITHVLKNHHEQAKKQQDLSQITTGCDTESVYIPFGREKMTFIIAIVGIKRGRCGFL